MDLIYADNAATTPVLPEVLDEMMPYFSEEFGNAASAYSLANKSRVAISRARESVARLIGAQPEEIFFTSGGTESDNWALRGAVNMRKDLGYRAHIVTSAIEHPAILRTCEEMQARKEADITYIPVDEDGVVSLKEVFDGIGPDTVLVSVMHSNNEIGTLEPVEEIAKAVAQARESRGSNAYFHTDAVQSVGHIPISVTKSGIDMLSASAHKFGGPKGIGFLYIRKGIPMRGLMRGGAQERGRRPGTENVPAIVGLGCAARLAAAQLEDRIKKEISLRDRLISRVLSEIPGSILNGPSGLRIPGNASFCFDGINGETLLMLMDNAGICASSGSACSTGTLEPSHVLKAIGRTDLQASGSVRLSLSYRNTEGEIDRIAEVMKEKIEDLRKIGGR